MGGMTTWKGPVREGTWEKSPVIHRDQGFYRFWNELTPLKEVWYGSIEA